MKLSFIPAAHPGCPRCEQGWRWSSPLSLQPIQAARGVNVVTRHRERNLSLVRIKSETCFLLTRKAITSTEQGSHPTASDLLTQVPSAKGAHASSAEGFKSIIFKGSYFWWAQLTSFIKLVLGDGTCICAKLKFYCIFGLHRTWFGLGFIQPICITKHRIFLKTKFDCINMLTAL